LSYMRFLRVIWGISCFRRCSLCNSRRTCDGSSRCGTATSAVGSHSGGGILCMGPTANETTNGSGLDCTGELLHPGKSRKVPTSHEENDAKSHQEPLFRRSLSLRVGHSSSPCSSSLSSMLVDNHKSTWSESSNHGSLLRRCQYRYEHQATNVEDPITITAVRSTGINAIGRWSSREILIL
jgi:hypothetical protein